MLFKGYQGAIVKFFLINLLVFLGISNVYAKTAKHFENNVPQVQAAEGGSSDCGGTHDCGGCCQGGSQHTAH
jgi:hypothetical protein